MAEEKEYCADLLPEEIQFICKMCHIAANKRMADKLECSSITVEDRYCKHIEKIRTTLKSQAQELSVYRKYISAFISEKLDKRTVYQKSELLPLYKEKVEEGKRSFEEFADLLRYFGIEVIG